MTCVWRCRQGCLGCCATTHGSSATEVALFRAVSPDPMLPEKFRSMEINVAKTAQHMKPGDLFLRLAWQNVSISTCPPSSTCLDWYISAWHVCYSLQVSPQVERNGLQYLWTKSWQNSHFQAKHSNHGERTGDKGMQKPHSKTLHAVTSKLLHNMHWNAASLLTKNPQAPAERGETNNELPQVQPYLHVS